MVVSKHSHTHMNRDAIITPPSAPSLDYHTFDYFCSQSVKCTVSCSEQVPKGGELKPWLTVFLIHYCYLGSEISFMKQQIFVTRITFPPHMYVFNILNSDRLFIKMFCIYELTYLLNHRRSITYEHQCDTNIKTGFKKKKHITSVSQYNCVVKMGILQYIWCCCYETMDWTLCFRQHRCTFCQ